MALSYSPFYRGTPYSPADAQRSAALASGPAYPVAREPVVSLPPKAVVAPKEEVVDIAASPFDINTFDFSNLDFSGYTGIPDFNLADVDLTKAIEETTPAPAPVREAKFYSDMSTAEQREVDAIRAGEAPSLNLNTYQGIPDLDFGVGEKYESPEQALSNYGDYFTNILGQREDAAKIVNYSQFDPSDFVRGAGTASTPLAYIGQASGESLSDYITKNKIPLSKEVDGKTMYLTTGDKNASFRLMPDKFSGGELVAQGPVGTYSSAFVKDDSLIASVLKDPIIGLAASFIPGGTLAVTASKAAAGVDVSPVEIATSMLTGLEMAGVIKPPAVGADIAPKGGVGPTLPTTIANEGVGLFGQGYETTKNIITAAAAGDAKGAAIALVGKPLIESGLSKVGLDKAAIENAGIQYDDFEAGLNKVVAEVAGGAELDEALAAGLGTYIKEGGTLGSIDLPETDLDLGIIEDVVRDVVRPIGTVATEVAKFVEKAIPEDVDKIEDAIRAVGSTTEDVVRTTGSAVEDVVLEPIKELVEPIAEPVYKAAKEAAPVVEDVARAVGSTTEDVVRTAGSAVDDAVIQPIREAGKVIDDEVIQPIGDAFSALDTAIRDAMPDIDLPSVDLPSVDMPSFGLPSLEINYTVPAPSPTRTTDNLFRDELFQFQTEIEDTQERLEYIDLNDPDPFEASSLLQRYPF